MEDFVSYEIAVKLKEKGFPQHVCDDAYITENEYDDDKYLVGERWNIQFLPDYCIEVSAPTISQVLKWLRDEKKIYISIEPHSNDDFLTKIMWTWDAAYISDCKFQWYDGEFGFDTYENAAVSAIENVLNNLI